MADTSIIDQNIEPSVLIGHSAQAALLPGPHPAHQVVASCELPPAFNDDVATAAQRRF